MVFPLSIILHYKMVIHVEVGNKLDGVGLVFFLKHLCGIKRIVGVDLEINEFLRMVKISITHVHRNLKKK